MFPLKDNVPTRHFPVVTVGLIVANVLVYFLFQHGGLTAADGPIREYAFQPCEVDRSCSVEGEDWPLTSFTSMFMHGDITHLGGNMLFLWIFGNNVEDSMGRVKFVAFYLLGGLAATAAHTLSDPNSAVPTLGASGAVAAVLGAYALLYPRARVVTLLFIIIFITVIELPAWLVLFGWAVLQVLSASAESGVGGVAYLAHIGGFLFGLAAIKLFASRRKDDYVEPRYPVY
jgi:membrane associated rhomboid family serine protease